MYETIWLQYNETIFSTWCPRNVFHLNFHKIPLALRFQSYEQSSLFSLQHRKAAEHHLSENLDRIRTSLEGWPLEKKGGKGYRLPKKKAKKSFCHFFSIKERPTKCLGKCVILWGNGRYCSFIPTVIWKIPASFNVEWGLFRQVFFFWNRHNNHFVFLWGGRESGTMVILTRCVAVGDER